MQWFNELERRRHLALFLVMLVTVAILAASNLREPFALDSYWHLKTGQDLVEKGLSPFQDHYSVTHYGHEIKSPAIAFQLILYGFVSCFGLSAGFKALVFACGLLSLGLMLVFLRQIKAPIAITCLAVTMLTVLLQERIMVRPELIDYGFLILSMILYEKARTGAAYRVMPYVVLTIVAWANYHVAILGYVIFFGLFIDLAIQQWQDRAPPQKWAVWVAWGVVVVLAGFLNPSGSHPLLETLTFSDDWANELHELRASLKGAVSPVTLALLPISAVTLLMALKQRLLGYLIVGAVFAWSSISMVRMVTPAGIVILCIFALTLTKMNLGQLMNTGPTLRRNLLSTALLLLFISTLTVSVLKARLLIHANQYMLGYFPDQIVQYMKANGKSGRIFNEYKVGGYLIYHLGDTSRVFMDGRTNVLYPWEHFQYWKNATRYPDALRAIIEAHDLDYVLLGNRRELVDLVYLSEAVQLDYVDLRYSLYARRNANFPVSGILWNMPWCWNDGISRGLAEERVRAEELLPEYSPLLHLIRLAIDFEDAQDREAFLKALPENNDIIWYESSLRYAGYRALELGLVEQANKWFSQLGNLSLQDYLAHALVKLRLNDDASAEQVLYSAIHTEWPFPRYEDFRIIQGLLTEISNRRPLTVIDKSYLDDLTVSLAENILPVASVPVAVSDFCAAGTNILREADQPAQEPNHVQ